MKKINYPTNRKSPHKHKVHTHDRQGNIVPTYDRGSGNKSQKVANRPRGKPASNTLGFAGTYSVTLTWLNYAEQTETLKASNFYSAALKVIEQRNQLESPIEERVRLIQ